MKTVKKTVEKVAEKIAEKPVRKSAKKTTATGAKQPTRKVAAKPLPDKPIEIAKTVEPVVKRPRGRPRRQAPEAVVTPPPAAAAPIPVTPAKIQTPVVAPPPPPPAAPQQDWKCRLGNRLDMIIGRTVPNVSKMVNWNSPVYGIEGQGWFLGIHTFPDYVKVTFFRGASLRPMPPSFSKSQDARHLDIRETDKLDEAQFIAWVKAASQLPGERM